jgi:hypothetical protein
LDIIETSRDQFYLVVVIVEVRSLVAIRLQTIGSARAHGVEEFDREQSAPYFGQLLLERGVFS